MDPTCPQAKNRSLAQTDDAMRRERYPAHEDTFRATTRRQLAHKFRARQSAISLPTI